MEGASGLNAFEERTPMEDRRQSPRLLPDHDVVVTIGGNRSARLIDISPAGAHLELSTALNPNQKCRIALQLGDETVRIAARVAHCKLTGFVSFGSGGQLVYRAGLEFVDLDPKLQEAIVNAFRPVEPEPVRRGPIKVKVNVDALEQSMSDREDRAN